MSATLADSRIDGIGSYLQAVVERNGPDPSEDGVFDASVRDVMSEVRAGIIAPDALNRFWQFLGPAFSTPRTLQGHVVAKPYGYDGDFELIDKIYLGWVSPYPQFANWDRFFHAHD